MLRIENEYRKAIKRVELFLDAIEQQKANLKILGLTEEAIEKAIQPSVCFYDQLKEDVESYEKYLFNKSSDGS